jgi:hypothetical protein
MENASPLHTVVNVPYARAAKALENLMYSNFHCLFGRSKLNSRLASDSDGRVR